jgi:hypothetical protein
VSLLTVLSAKADAQGWTADVWKPYTDKYGMIHTRKVGADGGPSTDNGPLFTAEACTIMQLQNVGYDRAKIAHGLEADQVRPGLFKRSPTSTTHLESPDDWVGLGALAGVCGFHDIARSILNYGTGQDQASGTTVAGLNIDGFTRIIDKIKQCTTYLTTITSSTRENSQVKHGLESFQR